MKLCFQTLRLLAKHLWPPIRKSGLPTAAAAFAAVVLFSMLLNAGPSKQTLLAVHLGITNTAPFQNIQTDYVRHSLSENTVTIHLRASPDSIEDLLRSQGFEERQTGMSGREQPEHFSVGPALPHPTREARFFHRVSRPGRSELIITDRDLTQLWFKSVRF
jgi:hypothetical protein